LLFCLPFISIGLWVGGSVLHVVWEWNEAKHWVEAPAVILETELIYGTGQASHTKRVHARYEYVFDGKVYSGDRVSVHDALGNIGLDEIGSFHQQAFWELEAYQLSGDPFPSLVDPKNPTRSLLYRNPRWGVVAYKALFAMLFTGSGAVLLFLGLFKGRKREREL